MQGDILYVYIVVSPHIVLDTLVKKEYDIQGPIYYVSRASKEQSQDRDVSHYTNNDHQVTLNLLLGPLD